MPRRVQSPSSINLYKQCPRRYYYQYIMKLPTLPSIHLVRGRIAHTVLEKFFEIYPSELVPDDLSTHNKIQVKLLKLLESEWEGSREEFDSLDMSDDEILRYKEDTRLMMLRFADYIYGRLEKEPGSLEDAFISIVPTTEERYFSKKHYVQGFIDVIEEKDGFVQLVDYKTSNKGDITPQYRLQLAIYAVLYQEKHGRPPDEVGIYFLKHDPNEPKMLSVDEDLMKEALFEIEQVHMSTESENIADYPKKPGPLCKYRTGQCDFYEKCFGKETQSRLI